MSLSASKTSPTKLIVAVTLVVFALIGIVAVGLASRIPKIATAAPISAHLDIGQVAPDFSVSTTAGPFSLSAAGHKPVLLEVFATWCPHCQRETATLNAVYERYKDTVDIVAVTGSPIAADGNSPASQADLMRFVSGLDVKYPVAYDASLDVAKKFLQSGYPTLVLIGKDGRVASLHVGETPIATIQHELDRAR